MLGKKAVSNKSNEITTTSMLLKRLTLAGTLVAIDAMGTQTAIARTIRDRGGDYLLAVKGNRPETLASMGKLFASPPPKFAIGTYETIDGGPARTASARRWVGCSPTAATPASRVFPAWPR